MGKLRGKQANRLANGLIILTFGFLLLLFELRLTDHWLWITYVKTPATFFFIAGIISLWLKREKFLGYTLTAVGAIGYANIAFGWFDGHIAHSFPIVVMATGVTLMIFAKIR